MWRVRELFVALALVCTCAVPSAARQQGGVAPYLAPQHWAHDAARRLHALGLAPDDFDPGLRARSVAEFRRILATARTRAEPRADRLALVTVFERRFAAEYEISARHDGSDVLMAAAVGGVEDESGAVLAGIGFLEGDWTGARATADRSGPVAALAGAGAYRGRVAGGLSLAARNGDGVDVEEAYAVAGWRNIGIWAGRRPVGYGTGVGGALVLSGAALTGVGGQLNEGYRLPGFLSSLGPVRLEGFVSRVRNQRQLQDFSDVTFRPYFGAARISGSPFTRRLTLGASRGAMFGGEGNAPVTLRNFVTMLYGQHAGEQGEFHHEVFALDATFRPPLRGMPVLLRVEWGMDDSSGMFYRAPSIIWAVELGALPGLPQASIGFERTLFSGCFDGSPADDGGEFCKNTYWYRNWYFRGGWTDDGRVLGHPLGGHGREHILHVNIDPLSLPLGLAIDLRSRERRSQNLFAPERQGGSTLLGARLDWQPVERIQVHARAGYEWGARDWSQRSLELRAGYRH